MRASVRVLVGVVVLALVATCSTIGCSKNEDVAPKDRLEKETGTRWVIKTDPVTETPSIAIAIDPIPPSAINGVSYETAARSFLDKYKDLFKLKDVSQELTFVSAVEGRAGDAVATFQQRAGGLPVDRRLLTVSFRSDKSIATVAGATRPRAAEAVAAPVVTADAARAAVEADLRKRFPDFDPAWVKTPPKPESVLFPDGPGAKLAWAISIDLESAKVGTSFSYRIDALSGAVLEGYQDVPSIAGTGTDVLGVRRNILVSEDGAKPGSFIMVQPAEGDRSAIATGSFSPLVFPITSTSLSDWDVRATFQGGIGAAVSAHANLAEVAEYYRRRFQWRSFDNQGTPLKAIVHDTRTAGMLATWNKSDRSIRFEDGNSHQGGPLKPVSGALDVCAHEFTHAVMQARIPGGGLLNLGEPGAVNEALADIFGMFAKKAIGASGSPEIIGDAIITSGIRHMAHPTRQKGNVDNKTKIISDPNAVHANAGIVGNAWWLMTMGGKNDTSEVEVKSSLGIEKSEDLWWEAVKAFQPTMGINQAADQVIATALRTFKKESPEFEAVACAFVATGVFTPEEVKGDYGVSCGTPKCTTPEAGSDACTCRATNPLDGTLCKNDPMPPVCTEVQTFKGNHGSGCTGFVLRTVEISRCFCVMSDGSTVLCPKPVVFTPMRGCPEPDGFKSYFGKPGTSCSGSFPTTDADGNDINQSGSGTMDSCSIEGTEQKWESVGGTLDCNSAAGGGPGPSACP